MLIVTGSDDNYVAGVLTLISSAAFHNPSAEFVVLDMGISSSNRSSIDSLPSRVGCPVRRIEISESEFQNIPVIRGHLTRSTYLRLLIPNLFPNEDRVIYMDCDMVVLDDLSELGKMPLYNNIIAAVPCPSPDQAELVATKVALGKYVNAGLLVMNLPVWRRESISDECIKILTDKNANILSEDQSAINIVAADRISILDGRYNTYSDPCAYAMEEDVPRNPAVIHYVLSRKPWQRKTLMWDIWSFHANRVSDLLPAAKPRGLKSRLSDINAMRRTFLGILFRKPKYVERNRRSQLISRLMEERISKIYLMRTEH